MRNIFFIIVLFCTKLVMAHGEHKFGPHGGYIQMPGAFHTEVVLDGKEKVKIYLLDIEWKNPTVKKSEISVKLVGKESLTANCKAMVDHYACSFSKPVNLFRKAELKVEANREGQKGTANYLVPLRLKPMELDPAEKSKHHH